VRIVSLVPSLTETLTSWGHEPVACTRFCERPDLPHVGGTKDPSLAAICDLSPDVVVMDTEENRREDHAALVAAGLRVHVTQVRSVEDVTSSLRELADVLGARWVPLELPTRPVSHRTVVVPIWRNPWMALGTPTYGASLLSYTGLAVLTGSPGPYCPATLDSLRQLRPDVVLAPSEPYPFTVRQHDELASVGPVIYVDGKDLFWWGSRTAAALRRLRTTVRPED
jgi:ABC-type hemin transport system substrate-binding protein